jgi:hypothetical protein
MKPSKADKPHIIQSIIHKPIEPVASNTLLFETKMPEPIIVPILNLNQSMIKMFFIY